MTKYVIYDNQGGNFGSWTEKNPQTEKELIEYFHELGKNEGFETKGNYSLDDIREIWDIRIEPIKRKSNFKRKNKGWHQESTRHSLARRGIKTGRKKQKNAWQLHMAGKSLSEIEKIYKKRKGV